MGWPYDAWWSGSPFIDFGPSYPYPELGGGITIPIGIGYPPVSAGGVQGNQNLPTPDDEKKNKDAFRKQILQGMMQAGIMALLMGGRGATGMRYSIKDKASSAPADPKVTPMRWENYAPPQGYVPGTSPGFVPGGWVPGFAQGGAVDEGEYITGPGAGMDDMVPAVTTSGQPVVLSDGEYVIPADVVSALGDGSSNAGARRLRELVNAVRKKKLGRRSQAPKIKLSLGGK